MPLNYSKWDALELSDDSDIEGHPNVDKRSLIRWKQRDIHEKREARKEKIAALRAEIDCNQVLKPRVQAIAESLTVDNPKAKFNEIVDRLKKEPRPDAPLVKEGTKALTYDEMVLQLMLKVAEDAQKLAGENGDVGVHLKELMDGHVIELGKVTENLERELDLEVKEQQKRITSEDVHEGFDNKYVPPKPAPPPIPSVHTKPKTKTTTTIEVLNPGASGSTQPPAPKAEEEGEEGLPELTPTLEGFAKLPLWDYQASWEYIQQHPDVVVPGAQDALLVAALKLQSEGKSLEAKKCLHQSKLLGYCESLGRDGVRVFFNKMMGGQAPHVFVKDVEDLYAHLVQRAKIMREEEQQQNASAEQIQLVAENPSQSISFNVPDGPPPEELVLEGEGSEKFDVEEVRKVLQMRWDVFSNFSEEMKEALKIGSLEAVNKVLGSMKVEEAERVVELLDMGGILNFAEKGIRDETGKSEAAS